MFILVPVLLGLKGNLEMNLASRMSTAVWQFASAHHTPKYGLNFFILAGRTGET